MIDPAVPAEPMAFRVLLDEAMKLTRRYFQCLPVRGHSPGGAHGGDRDRAEPLPDRMWAGIAAPRGVTPESAMFGGCGASMVTSLASLAVHGLTYAVLTSACVDGAAGRPITWSQVELRPAAEEHWTLVLAFFASRRDSSCLFLPGLYVGLRLSFVIPVMASESLAVRRALGRSWRLIRYNPHKRFLANTGRRSSCSTSSAP